MARFRSPITGRFVKLAAARRWGYKPIPARKKKPKPKPKRAPRAAPVEEDFDDFGFDEAQDSDFLFEQAESLEQFDFDELADLDEPWDDFIDDIVEDFDGIEETDYEDAQA